jgi:restriction endonuclease S subunit
MYNDEVLVMNKTNGAGKCFIQYNKNKFSLSGGVIIFKSKTKLINTKNLYIILKNNIKNIEKLYVGGDKKNISLTNFKQIKIPIPSLEDQEKVVKMIEDIEKEDSEYNKMLQSIKDMIQTIYDSIELITDTNEDINTNQENNNNQSEAESSEDEEEDNNIITHKGKEYYLEDNVVYRLKNGKKGKRYGVYKNDKVVKDKKEINIKV